MHPSEPRGPTDERIRGSVRAERVQRLARCHADPAALAGGVAAERRSCRPSWKPSSSTIDPSTGSRPLGAPGRRGAIHRRRGTASWLSRRSATSRPAAAASARVSAFVSSPSGNWIRVELFRVERGQHEQLVLVGIDRACKQAPAAAFDDAGVVTGPELGGACSVRERQELVEAEVAVAAPARIRCLATRVDRVDERVDDGVAELFAPVERHVQGVRGRGRSRAPRSRPRASNRRVPSPARRDRAEPERDQIARGPARSRAAALSTPPLIATAIRPGSGAVR